MRWFVMMLAPVILAGVSSSPQARQDEADAPGKQESKPEGTPVKPTPLTEKERTKQLNRRTSGALLGISTVNSFCSHAYALENVLLFSDLPDIGRIRLMNVFPESYKPTWREMLQTLARQTQTSWSYSGKHGGWLFDKPAMPLPFSLKMAEGWTREDRGSYLFCRPPGAPVGMDVYMLGTYSFAKEEDKNFTKVRDDWATRFLQRIKPDAKVKDMEKVEIDGVEALHFKTPAPKPGVIWRQWVFVKEGRAFAVVSALDAGQAGLLKDVRAMVSSLKVGAKKEK